jgi:hypothetical protein
MTQKPVLPYAPIERLTPFLWTVSGASGAGALRRRMVLVRLRDGSVCVHSGIAMEEKDMQVVDAWGAVRWIVVPNGYHRLDAGWYRSRYPDARVVCPSVWVSKVSQKVQVDGVLEEMPSWEELRWEYVEGTSQREVAWWVYGDQDTSLVLNDIVFNHPHMPGFSGWVMKMLGSTGGPRVTPVAKRLFVKDVDALKSQCLAWSKTPFLNRVVVSHGDVIAEDCSFVLQCVSERL